MICVHFTQCIVIVHSGTVRRRWRPSAVDSRCDIEMVLEANHILVTNEQRNTVLVTQELVGYWSTPPPPKKEKKIENSKVQNRLHKLLLLFVLTVNIQGKITCVWNLNFRSQRS